MCAAIGIYYCDFVLPILCILELLLRRYFFDRKNIKYPVYIVEFRKSHDNRNRRNILYV